ncbi:MAG: hypothetical protein JO220_14775 [Hyphomicrobiales bacterium]|nr:hypothetical protein [Hyphomicrobiales bacterium]
MVDPTIGNPAKRGNPGAAARVDMKAWLAKLDEYLDETFMPEGRRQPANPARRDLFGQ